MIQTINQYRGIQLGDIPGSVVFTNMREHTPGPYDHATPNHTNCTSRPSLDEQLVLRRESVAYHGNSLQEIPLACQPVSNGLNFEKACGGSLTFKSYSTMTGFLDQDVHDVESTCAGSSAQNSRRVSSIDSANSMLTVGPSVTNSYPSYAHNLGSSHSASYELYASEKLELSDEPGTNCAPQSAKSSEQNFEFQGPQDCQVQKNDPQQLVSQSNSLQTTDTVLTMSELHKALLQLLTRPLTNASVGAGISTKGPGPSIINKTTGAQNLVPGSFNLSETQRALNSLIAECEAESPSDGVTKNFTEFNQAAAPQRLFSPRTVIQSQILLPPKTASSNGLQKMKDTVHKIKFQCAPCEGKGTLDQYLRHCQGGCFACYGYHRKKCCQDSRPHEAACKKNCCHFCSDDRRKTQSAYQRKVNSYKWNQTRLANPGQVNELEGLLKVVTIDSDQCAFSDLMRDEIRGRPYLMQLFGKSVKELEGEE